MKRGVAWLVIGTFVAALILASTAYAAPPDAPFVGSWQGTDAFDGSTMTLHIGGRSGLYHVIIHDTSGTGCLNQAPWRSMGWATADGNFLYMSDTPIWCMEEPPRLWFYVDWVLEYDPSSDVLYEIVAGDRTSEFHRMGR